MAPIISTFAAGSANGFKSAVTGDSIVAPMTDWNHTNISTSSISGKVLTATSSNASGDNAAYTTAIPNFNNTTGIYFDVTVTNGLESGGVGMIGISNYNETSSVTGFTASQQTSWYYSGVIYGVGSGYSGSVPNLVSGTHRIALKSSSSGSFTPVMYMRCDTGSSLITFGPLDLPTNMSTYYIMATNQNSYPMINVTLGDNFYEGSGGLW